MLKPNISNISLFYNTSCFSESLCRGIHHNLDGDTCHLLYDTTDVPENGRSNYNVTSLTADGKKTILVKGFSCFLFLLVLQLRVFINRSLNYSTSSLLLQTGVFINRSLNCSTSGLLLQTGVFINRSLNCSTSSLLLQH